MNPFLGKFISSLPSGARLLVLAYALGFPLALAGQYSHTIDLYRFLALSPASVWHGQIWRLFSYAFLPNGIVDWLVSLFWLATLVSVLGRHWSGRELWIYGLLAILAGALPVMAFGTPPWPGLVGNGALIFGLLAAWYRLYGRERLILLGFGEISVRQAATLVTVIEAVVLLFCLGWFVSLAMLAGGLVGWLYLVVRGLSQMNRRSQVVGSERIARLEL